MRLATPARPPGATADAECGTTRAQLVDALDDDDARALARSHIIDGSGMGAAADAPFSQKGSLSSFESQAALAAASLI